MVVYRATIAIALGVGLGMMLGCGGENTPPPQINEVLGDTASGAPLAHRTADVGILADPASYSPPAGTTSGAAAGDAESAARELMRNTLAAITAFDVAPVLMAIDPERKGILSDRAVEDEVFAIINKVSFLYDTWKDRLDEPELQTQREQFERVGAVLTQDKLMGLLTFEVLDAEHVSVSVDATLAQQLFAELSAATEQGEDVAAPSMPMMLGGGMSPLGALNFGVSDAAGDPNSAAGADIPALVVANVAGEWMFQPPAIPADIDPQLVVTQLKQAQLVIDKVTELIDDVDAATLANPNLFMPQLMMAAMSVQQGGMSTSDEDDWGEEAATTAKDDDWGDDWGDEDGSSDKSDKPGEPDDPNDW